MANDLFADAAGGRLGAQAPLPQRVRPQALDEFAGQRDVIGEGSALQRAIAEDRVGSMIFYGPPGTASSPAGSSGLRPEARRSSPSGVRTAAAQWSRLCTKMPFRRAMPPSRTVSPAFVPTFSV